VAALDQARSVTVGFEKPEGSKLLMSFYQLYALKDQRMAVWPHTCARLLGWVVEMRATHGEIQNWGNMKIEP